MAIDLDIPRPQVMGGRPKGVVRRVASGLAIAGELAKVRVSVSVVITAAAGYLLAIKGNIQWPILLHTLMGTFLLAGGAAALNQFLEREFDGQMRRTARRPLPSKRVLPAIALIYGLLLGLVGFVWLLLGANFLAALLGAMTFLLYVGVYSPLKRVTIWNTVIGAVPGAIPPLMGWAAARGDLGLEAWLLFAILFCWQMPHFYAIAWLYRDDYRLAGYRMLVDHDKTGWTAGWHSALFAFGLLIASVWLAGLQVPGAWQTAAILPLVISASVVLLGGYFMWEAWLFARQRDHASARRLFVASILFVPLLSGLLVLSAFVWKPIS